ncbi:MAG: DUF4389 domain-containing protein [Rhodospirillales bacterium]|jgi:hypothetical protein|nr:DUF4389 domain-containing protein [Rhodospirillales bacterium]
MNEAFKSNLTNGQTWMRLVSMILFIVVFNVAELVIAFVVVVQFVIKLFTGEVNAHLAEFGDGLATYFRQMIAFLTFRTEDRPFPFAPWPQAASGATSDSGAPPYDAVIET